MPANSILKLKVDNTEYDANIRKAAEGIQHLAKRMHDAQGDFEGLDKASLDFIKDLQYMTTSAKTASGQYRELENAYKNLAATYEGLNAFEKEGDAGKALAEQLEILKKRTLDMKANMDAASKSLQTNAMEGQEDSSVLSKLADKFVVNVDALKLFNWGLQAAKGALKVAKDAFFASEASVDEWGRTVAASESVYEGFLNAINNGDISGYLSRIDQIVDAARKAYDELDRLGTMRTIQSPQMDRQNAENVRMRMMLMTGKYIAPAAGSGLRATMAEGTVLSPAQIKTLERQLQNGMQNIVKLTGNELKQTGKAIDAYYNKLAKENGMTMEEFRKGTSSMAEFDKRVNGAKAYEEFEARRRSAEAWARSGHNLSFDQAAMVGATNPYAQYKGWSTFRVDKQGENSYNELVGLIRQQQQQTSQMYSNIGQAYRTINRADNRISSGGGGKGGGNTKAEVEAVSGSIDEQTKLVQELQKAWRAAADDDSREKIKAEIEEQQYLLDRMTGKEKFDPTKMGPIADLTDFGVDMKRGKNGKWYDATTPVAPSEIKFSDGLQKWLNYMQKQDSEKKEVNLASEMSKIAGGVSGIFSGIESLGVELPQGLKDVMGGIQGMISILTSISTIVTAIQAISAADTLIPFARGGVVKAAVGYEVPGNHFSNDMVPALLNSGETVLNRAQSGILASVIEGAGNGFKNGQIVGRIEGEKIVLVANHFLKRSGQGELLTWKN